MKGRRDGMLLALCALLLLGALWGMDRWRKAEAGKPRSIVTTFAGDAGTMRGFAWRSEGSGDEAAIVQLAEGLDEPDWNGPDVAIFSGSVAIVTDGAGASEFSHKAVATGLMPGASYTYRVGNGTAGGWSEPASFSTMPVETEVFSFIHVTDSQGSNEADFAIWGRTMQQALNKFPEASFVVHGGDLTEEPLDGSAWGYLFREAPWARRIPFMPVTGNHDEVDGVSDMFTSFFQLPENGEEKSSPGTTYYFDYGNARFIMLNTESRIGKQAEWLRAVLEETDARWIVVSLHQGPYGGNRNDKADEWVKLFDEFKVDLVLQGHNHEYSRSYPLRNGEIVADGDQPVLDGEGTVYVVTNAAGQKLNDKKKDQFYHKVHMQNGKPAFAGVRVGPNELVYEAYDIDGALLDAFRLAKTPE